MKWHHALLGGLAAALALLSVTAPLAAQDPVQVGPTIYRVLQENAHVRVLEARFAKGAEIGMHSHPDHSVYVVKGGTLQMTAPDGTTQELTATPGQTLFIPASNHAAKNVGKKEIVVILTELKDSPAGPATLSEFERAELVAVLERSRDRTDALVARTSPELWDKRPDAGRWSVADVVEHLAASEDLLVGMAREGLAGAADPEAAAVAAGTSLDQLFGFALDRSKKYRTTEPLEPKGGVGREELVARLAAARAKTLDFARTTQAPVKNRTLTTPIGKLTVHQFLAFVAAHHMRHNLQIEEVLAEVGGAK